MVLATRSAADILPGLPPGQARPSPGGSVLAALAGSAAMTQASGNVSPTAVSLSSAFSCLIPESINMCASCPGVADVASASTSPR